MTKISLALLVITCWYFDTSVDLLCAQTNWESLCPENLRRPLKVSLERNPMQPLSRRESQKGVVAPADLVSSDLSVCLAGRPQGVVRSREGAALLLCNRSFVPGAELPLSPGAASKESFVSLRLKEVASDHLLVLVSRRRPSGLEVTERVIPLDPYFQQR